jgi:hypothetical protein
MGNKRSRLSSVAGLVSTGTLMLSSCDLPQEAPPAESSSEVMQELEEGWLACPVTIGPPKLHGGAFQESTPQDELPEGAVSETVGRRVRVLGGRVFIKGARPAGHGVLRVRGYGVQRVQWETTDGTTTCSPIVLAPSPVVTGRVMPPWGEITVSGCLDHAFPDDEGYFQLEVETDPCELRASRKDGPVLTYGEPVQLHPVSGTETELVLHLPEERHGGLGLRWKTTDEGWLVVGAFIDSPAAELGIRPGDLVTQVDSTPVVGLSIMKVPALVYGPEGSPVTIHYLSEGEPHVAELPRRYLEDPWEYRSECEPGTEEACERGHYVREGMELEF